MNNAVQKTFPVTVANGTLSVNFTPRSAENPKINGIEVVSGLPPAIVSDLKNYIYTDINSKARPQGGGSDLGAYPH